MAQLVNGETVYLSEQDRNFRYPQVIRKVVSDWTTLTFNWEGTLAGTDQQDEGVLVKATKKKVPLNTWFASVMMEPKFAEASLKEIAELPAQSLQAEPVLSPSSTTFQNPARLHHQSGRSI